MTLRAAQVIDFDGELPATFTPTSSDTFPVSDLPGILEVNNGSGASINVTIVDGGRTSAGTAAAAIPPVAVAAAAKKRIKLTAVYADTSASPPAVTVNFSATASVTCEFYRV